MRIWFVTVQVFVLAIAAGWLDAQTVRGRVVSELDRSAVGAAQIRLLDASGRPLALSESDSAGYFVVDAPRSGEYQVQVDQLGYERLRSPLLRLEVGDTVIVDFELPTNPIEIEGLRVEAEAQARIRRELRSFGVRAELLGPRFVDLAEIEKRPEARDFGRVLVWQSIPGLTIERSDLGVTRVRSDDVPPAPHPYICVRLRFRGSCALNVLNGAVITLVTGYEVPAESLGAIVVLRPEEATLLYGTDAAGGAVLLFTRDFGR